MKKIKTFKKVLSLGLAAIMLGSTATTAFALHGIEYPFVKDQGATNTGWAFGAMSVLEAKTYRENGVRIDCSEEGMLYANSNYLSEYLGKTPDIGSYSRDVYDNGNGFISASYLSRQQSPVSSDIKWVSPNMEVDVPFTANTKELSWNENVSTSYGNTYASNIEFLEYDIDKIKNAIFENEAVYMSFCANDEYLNSANGAYNNLVADETKVHGVAVIGYDDNYSKDNFADNCKPKNNGAWKIRNSYGTDWGNKGYGWISYEDVTLNINKDCYVITDIMTASKDQYTLSYDYLPPEGNDTVEITKGNTVKIANVYDVSDIADKFGAIQRVSFYTEKIIGNYNVYIVPMDADATKIPSNTGTSYGTGMADLKGYITAELRTPFEFDESVEKVAVIISFLVDTYDTTSVTLARESNNPEYGYSPVINAGESYRYANGEWVDVSENNPDGLGNYCIRPVFESREQMSKDSELSVTEFTYTDQDSLTLDLILNGNQLSKIVYGYHTLLEGIDYTVDGNAVTLSKNVFERMHATYYPVPLYFYFTDGKIQTLKVTRINPLKSATIKGKLIFRETLSLDIQGEVSEINSKNVDIQWQSSEDGVIWKDIKGATKDTYKLTGIELDKYIRAVVTAKENTNIPYPSSIISAPSETTVDRYGDVNLSGSVEISDATDLQSYIAKYMGLSDRQLLVANVNMDNYVNIKDATYIQMYVAKYIDTFPVNSY